MLVSGIEFFLKKRKRKSVNMVAKRYKDLPEDEKQR